MKMYPSYSCTTFGQVLDVVLFIPPGNKVSKGITNYVTLISAALIASSCSDLVPTLMCSTRWIRGLINARNMIEARFLVVSIYRHERG